MKGNTIVCKKSIHVKINASIVALFANWISDMKATTTQLNIEIKNSLNLWIEKKTSTSNLKE